MDTALNAPAPATATNGTIYQRKTRVNNKQNNQVVQAMTTTHLSQERTRARRNALGLLNHLAETDSHRARNKRRGCISPQVYHDAIPQRWSRTVGAASSMPTHMGMFTGMNADRRNAAGTVSPVWGCTAASSNSSWRLTLAKIPELSILVLARSERAMAKALQRLRRMLNILRAQKEPPAAQTQYELSPLSLSITKSYMTVLWGHELGKLAPPTDVGRGVIARLVWAAYSNCIPVSTWCCAAAAVAAGLRVHMPAASATSTWLVETPRISGLYPVVSIKSGHN
ncbi:hypothetical protein ON010_g10482 [Phytophthora cinnamomi]|nr:hypothetical protein ON010_g10482 [Phytophthora cinnamomi]